MKTIELKKMDLTPLSVDEIENTEGGGMWDFYEKAGYFIGLVVGTALRITNDTAKKLFEHSLMSGK